MSYECEDKIDISEYDLWGVSLEELKGLLTLLSSCQGCLGCSEEIVMLEKIILERESGFIRKQS